MTFEEMGNMQGKTLMLLPGTCCDWQSNFGSVVDVAFGYGEAAVKLCSHLIYKRREHPARSAPGSPEIHHHRLAGSEDFHKIGVIDNLCHNY